MEQGCFLEVNAKSVQGSSPSSGRRRAWPAGVRRRGRNGPLQVIVGTACRESITLRCVHGYTSGIAPGLAKTLLGWSEIGNDRWPRATRPDA
jgi:hypothetical protein